MLASSVEPLVFALSRKGRRARGQGPEAPRPQDIPAAALRSKAPRLPELSELDAVRHYGWVRLFVDRARAASGAFTLNEENLPAVVEIAPFSAMLQIVFL